MVSIGVKFVVLVFSFDCLRPLFGSGCADCFHDELQRGSAYKLVVVLILVGNDYLLCGFGR